MKRQLSCTEVKRFWTAVRKEHKRRFGHLAQVVTNEAGDRICDRCKRDLTPEIGTDMEQSGVEDGEEAQAIAFSFVSLREQEM